MPETTKKLDFILCFRSLSTQVFRVSFKLIVKKFSDVDFSTLTPFFVPSRFHANPYLEINDIEFKKLYLLITDRVYELYTGNGHRAKRSKRQFTFSLQVAGRLYAKFTKTNPQSLL